MFIISHAEFLVES